MIEAKKVHRGLEFNQRHTLAKPQGEFNIHKKTIEAEKNDDTINDQCHVSHNFEKLEKWNWFTTHKQPKKLFKMDIKTMFYVTINIW